MVLGTMIALKVIISNGNSDYPKGHPGAPVRIVVTQGESGTAIANDLAAQHVVANAATVIAKMIKRNIVGIAPGIHLIQSALPSDEALIQLLDQKRIVDSIYVLPGSTEADILKELHLVTSLKQKDDLKSIVPFYANPRNSLEGQLAPVQYSFQPGTSTHDALKEMLQSFRAEVAATKLDAGYKNFTPYQVLTVASLIQIESDPADGGKVARVIYNRLKIGMALQLNSTVQYALGLRGQIGLSIKATQIDSPYNTYLRVGLPPTPISNPSIASITAALNPVPGNWLYFITVKPHDTRFTDSFTTFENWVALYNHNVATGLFK
ncbi:MAG: endolytic transglycosylase MltG [Actinomycetes bacterium]